MSLLIPTVGENKLAEFMLGKATPSNQTLKLYVNDISPADGDTAGTYTEMSTHGYASKALSMSNWTVAQNGGVAEAVNSQQTWTFTAASAVLVYGYFVIDSSSGVLLWAERFTTSKSIEYAGDQIIITPKITLSKV